MHDISTAVLFSRGVTEYAARSTEDTTMTSGFDSMSKSDENIECLRKSVLCKS